MLVVLFAVLVVTTRTLLMDSTTKSAFWPPNGMIVVALLILPLRISLTVVASCFAINAVANAMVGMPIDAILTNPALNGLDGVVAGLLTRRFCGAATDLSRFKRQVTFAGIALFAAALEATVGYAIRAASDEAGLSLNGWLQWTICDALGMIVSTPALLLVMRRRRYAVGAPAAPAERWALLAMNLCLAVATFLVGAFPAYIFIYPLLVLTAFRAGPVWVLGSIMGVSLLTAAMTVHGFGPFAFLAPRSPLLQQDMIQTFLVSLFICALPANTALGERGRSFQRLARLNVVARNAQSAAVAANAAKSQFIANISHEIRTPLNGVLGMAQALAKSDLGPVQREQLDVVRSSGEVLLGLLNDVLDFSKIEAGKLELEIRPFSIEQIALDVHRIFSGLAEAKSLPFTVRVEPLACAIYCGDPTRVRQIMTNLVSNAIKFTAAGSVRLAVEAQDDDVWIRVSDSGIGIPEDAMARLFEKFQQVDASTSRRFGGSGLGLSICKDLAGLMGGALEVESVPDQGSTFSVRLPLARASDREAAQFMSAQAAAVEGPDTFEQTDLRILAAEDNLTNQLVLKTLLGQVGLTATLVNDGAEALHAWRNQEFDLILMDMQMPIMDGLTATRAIRSEEAQRGRRRTPIIALTADVMVHHLESYRAAGMDASVAKPLQFAQMMDAINDVLNAASHDALSPPSSLADLPDAHADAAAV